MTEVYLSIGTNLGNKIDNINYALANILSKIGVITSCSSIYQSEAWGYESENIFYNIALSVNTELEPEELLKFCKKIEQNAGRELKTNTEYSDRPLDIDILYYSDLCINSKVLSIPHPHRAVRMFVLVPMAEIAKNYYDIEKNATIQELLLNCHDKTNIDKLSIELNWKSKTYDE